MLCYLNCWLNDGRGANSLKSSAQEKLAGFFATCITLIKLSVTPTMSFNIHSFNFHLDKSSPTIHNYEGLLQLVSIWKSFFALFAQQVVEKI